MHKKHLNLVIDRVIEGRANFVVARGQYSGDSATVEDGTAVLVPHPVTLKPVDALFVAADANPNHDGDLIVYSDRDPVPISQLTGMRVTVI